MIPRCKQCRRWPGGEVCFRCASQRFDALPLTDRLRLYDEGDMIAVWTYGLMVDPRWVWPGCEIVGYV